MWCFAGASGELPARRLASADLDPGGSKDLIESFPMAPCTTSSSNPVTYSNPIHTQNRTLYTLHDTYRTAMPQQLINRLYPAGLKLSTYRSHSPELGWTHGDHLTPSRGCSIRPLLMAAAAGQPHLHVQSCLKFHAADAEADPSIPLATPVPLELTKSTQSEPHGDGNAGPGVGPSQDFEKFYSKFGCRPQAEKFRKICH